MLFSVTKTANLDFRADWWPLEMNIWLPLETNTQCLLLNQVRNEATLVDTTPCLATETLCMYSLPLKVLLCLGKSYMHGQALLTD